MSQLEEKLLFQIKAAKLQIPEREYRFCERRWRFDFAWPRRRFAVEVEGGQWVNGRHSRGTGMENDCEKYGRAMVLGWDVYRCTSKQIKSGDALNIIEIMLGEGNDNARTHQTGGGDTGD